MLYSAVSRKSGPGGSDTRAPFFPIFTYTFDTSVFQLKIKHYLKSFFVLFFFVFSVYVLGPRENPGPEVKHSRCPLSLLSSGLAIRYANRLNEFYVFVENKYILRYAHARTRVLFFDVPLKIST